MSATVAVAGISPNAALSPNTMDDPVNHLSEELLSLGVGDTQPQPWHFTLSDTYRMATKFHKEQDGKALQLSYTDRLLLVALTRQVSHGKFDPEKATTLGYLDVIGRDRRQAWMELGDLSRDDAMAKYIEVLSRVCPLFTAHVEAHKRDLEERERIKREEEERKRLEQEEKERARLHLELQQREEEERKRLEVQKRQIQDALNQQTFYQFKAYAEQQFPGNPEQQAVLVRQLQEQHYQQYMAQIYQQQIQQHSAGNGLLTNHHCGDGDTIPNHHSCEESGSDSNEEGSDLPPVAPASMWTRKDIREFKDAIRKEGGDSIIKVGHGETVTVRVPTHEDGSCLFWEFATDSYDIGFGVHFEWTTSPGNQVSVHISESEDEASADEEGGDPPENVGDDIERGQAVNSNLVPSSKPPITIIIPVYRRDCHEEIYAGSHAYPGQGVYLLKFDNSYSLWRSKTLYYRVYYTH